MSIVHAKNFAAPPVDRREILRYAGCRAEMPEISALLDECLREVRSVLRFSVCWAEYPVPAEIRSRDLRKNLAGCDRVVVFAATVGLELDRRIGRYSRVAPSKAVMLQAIGAERIEALCDAFQREIGCLRPRFSPGYGDLPLAAQREIFRALAPERHIGVSLNDSRLMSPSKSVTALIGVGKAVGQCSHSDCSACTLEHCQFRRVHG